MTATIVGVTTAKSGEAHIVAPVPAGTQPRDVLVAVLRAQSGNATWTAGAGWSTIGPPWESSSQRANAIMGRTVQQGDPTQWQFNAPAAVRQVMVLISIRGVSLPPSGVSPSYAGVYASGGRSTEAFTVTADSLVLLAAGSEFGTGSAHTPTSTPSGYTEIGYSVTQEATTASRSYVWVGQRTADAWESVAPATITWSSPSGQAVQAVALPLIPEADPSGPGLEVAIVDQHGVPQTHRLYITTVDGPRTPSTLLTVLHGYASVSDMLAGECWWAHRGGSASYPEHSMYGYTRSVLRGYGALEISLARTSDGVWFGLHDQTIGRTSGITGSPAASAMTWAQIQSYMITIGQQGAPQPYMRWDDLIDAYGGSHVLVCDPKYAAGDHRQEFISKCLSDIGADRCIVKWSGGLTELADAASAAGLATWGYWYQSNALAPEFAAEAAHWDLLGMEWGASQQAWDVATGLGRPVIGHVCETQAHVDTARAKGAAGFQCSGVGVITPLR